MPISNDDLCGRATSQDTVEFPLRPSTKSSQLRRHLSEESIRTELCEGPVTDDMRPLDRGPSQQEEEDHVARGTLQGIFDRAELIERLKRGEGPTWIPDRHVSVYLQLSIRLLFCNH